LNSIVSQKKIEEPSRESVTKYLLFQSKWMRKVVRRQKRKLGGKRVGQLLPLLLNFEEILESGKELNSD